MSQDTPRTTGRQTGTPRSRPRAVTAADTPESAEPAELPLWLIESPGAAPVIVTADAPGAVRVRPRKLPRGEVAYVLADVDSRTIVQRFGIAVIATRSDKRSPLVSPDGTAQRMIVKYGGTSKDGNALPDSVVWEGLVEAVATYRMHTIDHSRTLTRAEWSHFVTFRSINRSGIVRTADVALMQLRETQAKMSFIDELGLTTIARASDIIAYMRIIADRLPDNGIAIAGQGPVYLPDGTRAFVCESGVFDEHGNTRPEIIVDNTGIPFKFRYYDVTPSADLDPVKVSAGIADLIRAYGEIPAHPEIPGAFLASVFTASVSTLDPEFFIAPYLWGIPGSGKSRLSRRMDAIQSRRIRSQDGALPVLNLGMTTGTRKGDVYRVTEYGGFAITCDDVNKKGDSPAAVDNAKTSVSNLLRSHENGGGALGRVNKAKNRVESGQSGELHSNVRFTSELPIPGDSTLDRMIMLPPLTKTWEDGIFDQDMSEYLWTADSVERQAHAVSALTHWTFAHLSTINEYLAAARLVTRTWGVSARTAERYAAVVAAHGIFRAFAAEHGADASAAVDAAVSALADCARRQTLSKISPAMLFRQRLRMAIAEQRISFTGRPRVDKNGDILQEYTSPFLYIAGEPDESGVVENVPVRPPYIMQLAELGVIRRGKSVATLAGSPFGYVVPPAKGPNKRDAANRWQLFLTAEQLERLADALTKYSRDKDYAQFTPESIREILSQEDFPIKDRRRLFINDNDSEQGNTRAVTVIDMEWLFEPLNESEGE